MIRNTHRLIALILVISFTLTGSSIPLYANTLLGSDLPKQTRSVGNSEFILDSLSLPEELGVVSEVFHGVNGERLIIHIQDAHANYDSERNVAKLIEHFQKTYQVPLVFLEGGGGVLDSLYFQSFPDAKLKEKILHDYLKNGDLQGGEAASILSNGQRTRFFGIEDQELYRENKQTFLEAIQKEKQILEVLSREEAILDEKSQTILSLASKKFLAQSQSFQNETINLLEYLKALLPLRGATETIYPELTKILKSEQNEKTFSGPEFNMAMNELIQSFKSQALPSLSKDVKLELGEMIQQYQTGMLERGFLVRRIQEVSSLVIPDILQPTAHHAETLSSIKGTKLFDELEQLEDELRNALPQSEEEKTFLHDYKRLELLKSFAKLEITHKQWSELQRSASNKYEQKLSSPQSFSGDLYSRLQHSGMTNLYTNHLRFYELALKRDEALFNNLTSQLASEKASVAIVVTGGFHKEGIQSRLKESNISYLSITPRINELGDKANYLKAMKDERSFMKYFRGSLWDALAKDYTSKLAASMNERELTSQLKRWRDQIIQSTIAEGRITDATSYTKYVDVLAQAIQVGHEKSSPFAEDELKAQIQKELETLLNSHYEKLKSELDQKLAVFSHSLQIIWSKKDFSAESVRGLINQLRTPAKSTLAAPLALTNPQFGGVVSETGDLENRSELRAVDLSQPTVSKAEPRQSGSLLQRNGNQLLLTVEVRNENGIHVRPSSYLMDIIDDPTFKATLRFFVKKSSGSANRWHAINSLSDFLNLHAAQGSQLQFMIEKASSETPWDAAYQAAFVLYQLIEVYKFWDDSSDESASHSSFFGGADLQTTIFHSETPSLIEDALDLSVDEIMRRTELPSSRAELRRAAHDRGLQISAGENVVAGILNGLGLKPNDLILNLGSGTNPISIPGLNILNVDVYQAESGAPNLVRGNFTDPNFWSDLKVSGRVNQHPSAVIFHNLWEFIWPGGNAESDVLMRRMISDFPEKAQQKIAETFRGIYLPRALKLLAGGGYFIFIQNRRGDESKVIESAFQIANQELLKNSDLEHHPIYSENEAGDPRLIGFAIKKKFRALIVQDTEAFASQIESALLEKGFSVDTAHNYKRAHELIFSDGKEIPYDVILLDKDLSQSPVFDIDNRRAGEMLLQQMEAADMLGGNSRPKIIWSSSDSIHESIRFGYLPKGERPYLINPAGIGRWQEPSEEIARKLSDRALDAVTNRSEMRSIVDTILIPYRFVVEAVIRFFGGMRALSIGIAYMIKNSQRFGFTNAIVIWSVPFKDINAAEKFEQFFPFLGRKFSYILIPIDDAPGYTSEMHVEKSDQSDFVGRSLDTIYGPEFLDNLSNKSSHITVVGKRSEDLKRHLLALFRQELIDLKRGERSELRQIPAEFGDAVASRAFSISSHLVMLLRNESQFEIALLDDLLRSVSELMHAEQLEVIDLVTSFIKQALTDDLKKAFSSVSSNDLQSEFVHLARDQRLDIESLIGQINQLLELRQIPEIDLADSHARSVAQRLIENIEQLFASEVSQITPKLDRELESLSQERFARHRTTVDLIVSPAQPQVVEFHLLDNFSNDVEDQFYKNQVQELFETALNLAITSREKTSFRFVVPRGKSGKFKMLRDRVGDSIRVSSGVVGKLEALSKVEIFELDDLILSISRDQHPASVVIASKQIGNLAAMRLDSSRYANGNQVVLSEQVTLARFLLAAGLIGSDILNGAVKESNNLVQFNSEEALVGAVAYVLQIMLTEARAEILRAKAA